MPKTCFKSTRCPGTNYRTVIIFCKSRLSSREHGIWGKDTLFEESLRVTFIRKPGELGGQTDALVELVDLYRPCVKCVNFPSVRR